MDDGRIAEEVGVQPRIVSLWRHRYADHGLDGLQDKPRPGKQPIYTKATDKRIPKSCWTSRPRKGSISWTVSSRLFRAEKLHVTLDNLNTHKKNEHWLKAHPNVQFHFAPTSASSAQSGRGMVFDLAGAVAQRHLFHKPQAASGTHRCLRQRVQRQSRALRLD